nr:uncharacterized protein LOC108061642 [Drosophila takahashii]
MLIKKLPTRSTAGNIEQSPDDDGIWFECNVPFRVNIPFPISMKNLFGSQTFSGNSNLQIFKALAPTGIIQKDTKMKYPFNVSMCPALPPEDLESNMYTPKATKCAKKKGLRRGRKHCPCETSTQTIEDESDPVLSCLEQIRKQLAAKSPEIQEKNIFRCFAEKSTNVRSIQKQTNEPDVEKVKDSASKETFQDKTPSSTMSQKSLETTSLNMLPLPNPEDTKIENLNNVPKTPSNANSKRSSICIESKKESQGKNETIPNSNREDIELPNLKDADKEKDLLNATKPVLKSAICFCRLPQCPPKCTRIMIPGSMCQGHFMGKYHMPRWQYSRPTQQQYIQRQENQTRNKPNQRHNSRISSGGESVPEDPTSQGYKNGQIYEIEEQRDNTEINKSEKWFYKQRSQSAPECWILQGYQRNHTNRSEKSYLCQSPQCRTYHENVLVLQDETCESESDDYELVRDDKDTSNSRWCECQTPDYSINADILKQLREQERPCNPHQVQGITSIPRGNQCPDDCEILQQEQGRENPPLVLVPFRMNRRKILSISRPKKCVNKSVTLMQPRKLRSSDSAGIRNIENTVLIETRTPCNRENLLQTCGRPPCNFCPRQYTGLPPSLQAGFMISKPPDHTIQPQTSMSAPQNLAPFDENYLIDPRDQWRTIKSPASAPVMKDEFQHQGLMNSYQPTNSLCPHFQEHPSLGCHQFNNPGYYTQKLKDNINMLPEGFYDHTVNKYNITRMDSNFQPPPLLPEFLLAQQQHFIRHPAFPHGNQFQQHLVMGSVQQLHRPFIPTQNQYPAELQTHPTMFCPQQSVKLDDYDQSEYQI